MKLVKKVFKNKTHKNKQGKECVNTLYVLVTDNGKEIAVKPVYANDYALLNYVAEVKVYGKENA